MRPSDERETLLEAARILRERSEVPSYGYGGGGDPHDFTPDPECTTPEERARHQLACEAWDRGDPVRDEPPLTGWQTREAAEAHIKSCMERGAVAASIYSAPDANGAGEWIVHCHVGGWGMGTVIYRDPDALSAAEYCERIAEDMPYDSGEDGPF